MRVWVVGAGVVGLTCAVRLLEAGHRVDVPVLLLYGSKDALNRSGARADQAASYSTRVTSRTFRGAGSALPLEQPRAVRSAVLSWLHR